MILYNLLTSKKNKIIVIQEIKSLFIQEIKFLLGTLLNKVLIIDHCISSKKNLIEKMNFSENKIAIITTHDPSRLKNVQRYVNYFDELGFLTIIVVNGGSLEVSFKGKNAITIHRTNRGYDLAALRDVFNYIDKTKMKEVIFINDSINYNLKDLEGIYNILNSSEDQILYGLFVSHQRIIHLQSYLIYLQGDLDSFIKLQKVFNQFNNWKFKRSAVTFGEQKIMNYAGKIGLDTTAIFESKKYEIILIPDEIRKNLNPIIDFQDFLKYHGFSFKKIDKLSKKELNE
jgi:hypothetical protein